MTREQYDELSAPLVRVVNDMEDDILRLIAAQLARDGDFSDTSRWRMRQLARAGKLDKQAAALIAKYTGIQSDILSVAVEIAALTEIGYLDNAVADLQRQGLLAGVPELPAEKSAMGAYKAFQAQAQSDLNLVNTVMQYKARSSFAAAVNAAYHESKKSRQAALDVMGKHSAAAVAGHMSLQEATRRCIRQLAEKGIPAFVDKSGREWSPEAYVMMDMRSTLGNTARAAQDMRCDKYGFKLIEVSSHMGARPLCAKFQGKIYSRDGSRGVTADGRGNKIYFTPLSETSYGEPAGLFGINCGHVQYPFVEGCSFQRYFPYPEEENSKRYRQFQQQRYLERQVRASKRECMMLTETGDKEGFAKASARLKARKKQYTDYCKDTGLKMHNDRTQVLGFDRSVSAKTAWANRKALSSQNHLTRLQKSITLKSAKDFDELSNYLNSTYNITLDNAVKQLNFNLCKEVIIGVESVFKQFPDLHKNISEILTDKSGVMCCNGRQIMFNPNYFLDENVLRDMCKKQSSTGYWINNSSPASIGVHETAHAIEQLLVDSNTSYIFPFQKTLAWNDCTEAKAIVSQACKNIKKTPYGKGKKNNELRSNISRYSLDSSSETMAEAFADVFANGENAQPISVEIVKLTKEKYDKYKGVT